VSHSALLRISPPLSPSLGATSPRLAPAEDLLPPLRRPRDPSPERTLNEAKPFDVIDVKAIKPNFMRYAPERVGEDDENTVPAPRSLVPRLKREEYYSNPSVEAMSRMSEAKLSRIDNLEIGRYGFGSVRWPGLTDVRCLDFDQSITIDRGSLILYPESDRPKVGEGLNKEAVVTLHVRPSRGDAKLKSVDVLRARLTKISEEFGGRFISYDMEKWIFLMPHFNGINGGN